MSDFTLTGWLCEGINGVRDAIRGQGRLLPEDFYDHARASGREMVLAVRTLVDAATGRCDRPGHVTRLKQERTIKIE